MTLENQTQIFTSISQSPESRVRTPDSRDVEIDSLRHSTLSLSSRDNLNRVFIILSARPNDLWLVFVQTTYYCSRVCEVFRHIQLQARLHNFERCGVGFAEINGFLSIFQGKGILEWRKNETIVERRNNCCASCH